MGLAPCTQRSCRMEGGGVRQACGGSLKAERRAPVGVELRAQLWDWRRVRSGREHAALGESTLFEKQLQH